MPLSEWISLFSSVFVFFRNNDKKNRMSLLPYQANVSVNCKHSAVLHITCSLYSLYWAQEWNNNNNCFSYIALWCYDVPYIWPQAFKQHTHIQCVAYFMQCCLHFSTEFPVVSCDQVVVNDIKEVQVCFLVTWLHQTWSFKGWKQGSEPSDQTAHCN